jgi:catechol-2,3-dioxygenase
MAVAVDPALARGLLADPTGPAVHVQRLAMRQGISPYLARVEKRDTMCQSCTAEHRPSQPGRAAVRPALHHFGLTTTNLTAMVEWYAAVLGMDPTHQSQPAAARTGSRWRTAWVTNDQANHRIAIMALPGLADNTQRSRHKGLHHVAFEYPDLDDLLATYTRLKGLGIEPVRSADHGPITSLYYEDPDRNTIELLVDNFGDGEQSSAFMRTSTAFAENPMGTDVDPEQLLVARAAGMSVAELHERAYAGEFCSARGFYRHCLAGNQ